MKKIKNIVLIFIIILLVSFLVFLSIYKFTDKQDDNKEIKYNINELSMETLYNYDINYLEEYKDNIINDVVKSIEYSMAFGEKILYGRVFIGNHNKLYISDDLLKKSYLILDEEVTTLYNTGENSNSCAVFVIAKNGNLYYVSLAQPEISSYRVEQIDIQEKVTNFTNLKLNTYMNSSLNSVIVLTNEGNMYDTQTLTKYNPNTVNILNQYIVYETGRISNMDRHFLMNSNKEKYKVKVIAVAHKPLEELKDNPRVIIVTEDDKLIYLSNNKTYEYPKKVKVIGVDNSNNNIVVYFEDEKLISFSGFYNYDYYPVLYKENESKVVE